VLKGEFDPAEALRYYPEDQQAGFILLCTGPATQRHVHLDAPRDAMRAQSPEGGPAHPARLSDMSMDLENIDTSCQYIDGVDMSCGCVGDTGGCSRYAIRPRPALH
jgi:hypothetical protein